MANGIIKSWLIVLLLGMAVGMSAQQYQVKATECSEDMMDFSQRSTRVVDQNGDQCAVLRIESAIPGLLKFELGAQDIEHKEIKDDEVWLWVSTSVKKITIRCDGCKPLKDYRPGNLEGGHIYHFKVTTGHPKEQATKQHMHILCHQVPFFVSIDGKPAVESTKNQFTQELSLGTHNIVVSATHYKSFTKDIKLTRSAASRDTVNLAPNFGTVTIRPNVQGCKLFIDNQEFGINGEIKLDVGQHQISVRKEKYTSHEEKIVVHIGDKHIVNANLTPNFIPVTITAKEPETEIYINEEYKGVGKCVFEFDYNERYEIEGRRKGCQTHIVERHDFNANSPKTIAIPELKRLYGTLNISFLPKEATLKIDGITRPTKNGEFSDSHIEIGQHVIQVRHDDYRSAEETVTIENGELTAKSYELIKVPTGIVTIKTDDGVAILLRQDHDLIYKSSSEWTGKLPIGENEIVLRNTEGLECEYKILVDEDKKMEKKLKFFRNLKVSAPTGSKVMIQSDDENKEYSANKKLTLQPQEYTIVVSRKNYADWISTVDLSPARSQYVKLNAVMYREGGSTSSSPSSSSTSTGSTRRTSRSTDFLDRFYSYSGDFYIGVIGMGYTYNIVDKTHWLSFSLLPMRFKMFEMHLFDVETNITNPAAGGGLMSRWIYKPTLQLVIPVYQSLSINLYGGAGLDMNYALNTMAKKSIVASNDFYAAAVAGITFRTTVASVMPMDLFAEYRYPIVGQTDIQPQGFRVGINMSFGAPKW